MGNEKRSSNELIRRRKKKRLIKRMIVFLVILVITGIILCLKLPYFNIVRIDVINNKLVTKEEINKLADVRLGKNIFLTNTKQIENKVLSCSYISKVSIKRKFPSTITLDVKERVPELYIAQDKNYILLDSEGYVLDSVESIENMNLIQFSGLDFNSIVKGKKITDDLKKLKQLFLFSDLQRRNLSDVKISSVDIKDVADMKVIFNKITVNIGNSEGMEKKLNDAINIISQQNLKDATGYIDVSYKEKPVISIQK